jgi:DNA-binding PadR family transcriptional regulator
MNTPREKNNSKNRRTLPQTAGWILVALASQPLHGGAISEQVVADTVGGYIPDTTLYRLLDRLSSESYIEAVTGTDTLQLTIKGRDYVRWLGASWERLGRLALSRLR